MSSANAADDEQFNDRLAAALDDQLDDGEEWTDLTVEEFGEVLCDAGLAVRQEGVVRQEEVAAHITGEAPISPEKRLEAYGSGMQFTPHERRGEASEEALAYLTEGEDADPEEYGTGVDGDTTREERRRREEQAEILADALEKAQERRRDN